MATNSVEAIAPAQPGRSALSSDPRWLLAQRIAVSDIFSKSEFLPRFLLHICALHLQDKDDEIREQNIGVRVFGRPPSYNPGDDNIVRNYAVQLRKRLNLYFEREGHLEEFRIEIPRGAYVPVFRSVPVIAKPQVVAPAPPLGTVIHQELPSPAPLPLRRADWRMFLAGFAMGLLLLAVSLFTSKRQSAQPPPQTVYDALWSAMFPKDRDTLIVPADSSLGILQNLTKEPASLTTYSNGAYLSDVKVRGLDQGSLDDLRTQRYTSMVDLNITSRLSHLPEVFPDHLVIRYARDLRMDDLKHGNAILLGAIHTDPWVNLLQGTMNFQFACGRRVDDCYILNSHPKSGESPVYRSDASSPYRQTYSIVALLPNLDHTGWILLIEGLNMAGTEAAANMLLDDATMRPVLRRAFTPNGTPRAFELLIQTGSLQAEALPAKIVAQRFAA